MEKTIDYIITYSNFYQRDIFEQFINAGGTENNLQKNNIYETILENVKLVRQNLYFVRNIYITCKREHILPEEIFNYGVIRVNEDEFIPEEFLPSFNSTTVEMFLYRIEGLSEKFIYANDDMYVLKPVDESCFFKNDKPIISFCTASKLSNEHDHICNNNTKLIFNKNYVPFQLYLSHTLYPMTKTICSTVFNKYEEEILSNISTFRQNNNYNFYLYLFDSLINDTDKVISIGINKYNYKFYMVDLKNTKDLIKTVNYLSNNNDVAQIICINDGYLNLEKFMLDDVNYQIKEILKLYLIEDD